MYFAATSYNIYSNTKSIMVEYLTKKFFVVQTPKIKLKSPPTIIMEPSKPVTLLFAVPSCIFCSNSRKSFYPFHNKLFFS